MHAVVADRPGALSRVLALRSVDPPGDLGAGEVAVRMVASTINPSDAITVSGAYPSRTVFPLIPGFEGVGIIERAGPDCPPEWLGRRVLPIGSAGAWQQVKRTERRWCIPVPDGIDDLTACFAYINPLTATLMVDRFVDDRTRRVVVSAANSTIAAHIAELLRLRGIEAIGLVRGALGRPDSHEHLWRDLVSTDRPGWQDNLRSVARDEIDLAFDCVGGPLAGELADLLAPGGTLVSYGLLSGRAIPAERFGAGRTGNVAMFRLREFVHTAPRVDVERIFQTVFDHLQQGRLRTRIGARVSLDELPEFLRYGAGAQSGKTLITYERRAEATSRASASGSPRR